MRTIKLNWSDLQKAVDTAKESDLKKVGFEARTQFEDGLGSIAVNIEIDVEH